ncbi:hypothetical protein CCACVL1_09813 [Corchorus capsularis]|uniref:Cystatin domain-containing protein n=1 Tax=Corchorus capsularis TaxID=210143 RepID=A0A1R3IU22_COCAP|nr:hypothetical protein CCACVL1_09813 [Corchorus capsularis]
MPTDAELEQYFAAVAASRGFDVPAFPDDVSACCVIIPLDLTEDGALEELEPLCLAAVDYLNRNGDYKFQKLVKANSEVCGFGINHYLTLKAYNSLKSTTETFEAIVLMGFPEGEDDDCPLTVSYCDFAKS